MTEVYLTANFKRSELACPCCSQCPMDSKFMAKLQKMRDHYNRPITINSGYRCAKHNANPKVKGEPNSRHLYGIAADLHCPDIYARRRMIEAAIKAGLTTIIIYPTFVHVDDREGTPAILYKTEKGFA